MRLPGPVLSTEYGELPAELWQRAALLQRARQVEGAPAGAVAAAHSGVSLPAAGALEPLSPAPLLEHVFGEEPLHLLVVVAVLVQTGGEEQAEVVRAVHLALTVHLFKG